MSAKRPSYSAAVAAFCRSCIYDPEARGTWREQVAACADGRCPLHQLRPVPRACRKDGLLVPSCIASVRDKIEGGQRAA